MFNRKKKIKELENELIKKDKLIDAMIQNEEEYMLEINELKEKIKEKQHKDYEEYKYAILVPYNRYPYINLWNEGRFEEGIRSIEFNYNCEDLPELIIKK